MKTIIGGTWKKKFFLVFLFLFITLGFIRCTSDTGKSLITQKPLPYPENALEPYISAETVNLHYGKHHAGYVAATRELVAKSPFKDKHLVDIVRLSAKKQKKYKALFNNAAQAWNHEFFWESLRPEAGGKPGGKIGDKIKKSFGSYQAFQDEFILSAKQLFGSGWVWLIINNRKLKIITTCNADTPVAHGQRPLFVIDIWEHAYYLDYRNKRCDYVKAVLENLIDWDRVETLIGEDT